MGTPEEASYHSLKHKIAAEATGGYLTNKSVHDAPSGYCAGPVETASLGHAHAAATGIIENPYW